MNTRLRKRKKNTLCECAIVCVVTRPCYRILPIVALLIITFIAFPTSIHHFLTLILTAFNAVTQITVRLRTVIFCLNMKILLVAIDVSTTAFTYFNDSTLLRCATVQMWIRWATIPVAAFWSTFLTPSGNYFVCCDGGAAGRRAWRRGGRQREIRCNFVRFESCVQAAAVCSDVAAVVRRRFMSFVLTAAAAGSLLRCVQCWLQSTYFWYLEWRVERGEWRESVEKQSRKVQKNGLGDASVMCRHQVILVALLLWEIKMKIY